MIFRSCLFDNISSWAECFKIWIPVPHGASEATQLEQSFSRQIAWSWEGLCFQKAVLSELSRMALCVFFWGCFGNLNLRSFSLLVIPDTFSSSSWAWVKTESQLKKKTTNKKTFTHYNYIVMGQSQKYWSWALYPGCVHFLSHNWARYWALMCKLLSCDHTCIWSCPDDFLHPSCL